MLKFKLNHFIKMGPGFNVLLKLWKASANSSLQWSHNELDGISNHQPHDCLLNRLFRCRSKKTSKHRVTGLCEGNSLVTSEFPTQRASKAENGSIWWHHVTRETWGHFSIKSLSYQFRDSHCKWKSPYLERWSSHWNRAMLNCITHTQMVIRTD